MFLDRSQYLDGGSACGELPVRLAGLRYVSTFFYEAISASGNHNGFHRNGSRYIAAEHSAFFA
jgi:hypothetical protein